MPDAAGHILGRVLLDMTDAPATVTLSKRKIQRISLADFAQRKHEITEQLMHAATDLGFFMISDTGMSQGEVKLLHMYSRKPHVTTAVAPLRKPCVEFVYSSTRNLPCVTFSCSADRLHVRPWRPILCAGGRGKEGNTM